MCLPPPKINRPLYRPPTKNFLLSITQTKRPIYHKELAHYLLPRMDLRMPMPRYQARLLHRMPAHWSVGSYKRRAIQCQKAFRMCSLMKHLALLPLLYLEMLRVYQSFQHVHFGKRQALRDRCQNCLRNN